MKEINQLTIQLREAENTIGNYHPVKTVCKTLLHDRQEIATSYIVYMYILFKNDT